MGVGAFGYFGKTKMGHGHVLSERRPEATIHLCDAQPIAYAPTEDMKSTLPTKYIADNLRRS